MDHDLPIMVALIIQGSIFCQNPRCIVGNFQMAFSFLPVLEEGKANRIAAVSCLLPGSRRTNFAGHITCCLQGVLVPQKRDSCFKKVFCLHFYMLPNTALGIILMRLCQIEKKMQISFWIHLQPFQNAKPVTSSKKSNTVYSPEKMVKSCFTYSSLKSLRDQVTA